MVLAGRDTCPCTVSDRVVHILVGGVATGARYRSSVLRVAVGSVAAVGQGMAGVLVSTVPAGRTGFCSAVLSSIIVRPASVGETVALLGGGADVGATSGAVGTRCVLAGTVF